eukprot:TRINITY_DN14947_c0_g1_i1.p1 TRINITY_DN14947_c0_g1~~TRINITY_DN14947_c0_g1_i1.p1  ORF type:complete len:530 (-),score=171.74 TRINITY_DN14947_c0_g1_i1:54-1466(-)
MLERIQSNAPCAMCGFAPIVPALADIDAVIESVYGDLSGFGCLTLADRQEAVRNASDLLYGEVRPEGVVRLLDADHLDVQNASILFDLGSGVGKLALQAFLQFDNLRAVIGVELAYSRFQQSRDALAALSRDLQRIKRMDERSVERYRVPAFQDCVLLATVADDHRHPTHNSSHQQQQQLHERDESKEPEATEMLAYVLTDEAKPTKVSDDEDKRKRKREFDPFPDMLSTLTYQRSGATVSMRLRPKDNRKSCDCGAKIDVDLDAPLDQQQPQRQEAKNNDEKLRSMLAQHQGNPLLRCTALAPSLGNCARGMAARAAATPSTSSSSSSSSSSTSSTPLGAQLQLEACDECRLMEFRRGSLFDAVDVRLADIVICETMVPPESFEMFYKLLRSLKIGCRVLTFSNLNAMFGIGDDASAAGGGGGASEQSAQRQRVVFWEQLPINVDKSDVFLTTWNSSPGHHFYLWKIVR